MKKGTRYFYLKKKTMQARRDGAFVLKGVSVGLGFLSGF